MLRATCIQRHFRARVEFDRLRSLMRGRCKMERKIGIRQMTFMVKQQTKYRVELESYWRKAVVRKGIDAAAIEHGTGWTHIKNDMSRQNVDLLPTAQGNLAKYEPLAFRALMELCASDIAPPAPATSRGVIPEAYETRPQDPRAPTSASRAELREKVRTILSRPCAQLASCGLKTEEAWLDAWKQFEVVDPAQRLAYRK